MNELSQEAMDDMARIDQTLIQGMVEEGHTHEEAAKILVDAKKMIMETCRQMLEELKNQATP